MAEVRPLQALHYDLSASRRSPTSPRRRMTSSTPGLRAELLARSPFNVVEIDLPAGAGRRRPVRARRRDARGVDARRGCSTADREPAIWALTQDYTAPDGSPRTRRGFLARVRRHRVRPGPRPPPRAHPARPEGGPAAADPGHPPQPLADLRPSPRATPGATSSPGWPTEPWGEVTDADGTIHRVWRIADPAVHEALAAELADAELLIADGHHRYETARVYAERSAARAAHRYMLDVPRLARGPRPDHLRHPPPAQRPRRGRPGAARDAGIREQFELEEVAEDDLDPAGERRHRRLRLHGRPPSQRGFRLRLKDPAALDEALAGRSEAYRRLDAAILEELILKRTLGMTRRRHRRQARARLRAGRAEALAPARRGRVPTPPSCFARRRSSRCARSPPHGETMPPKSTYFFPKVLTGIVFNPLS